MARYIPLHAIFVACGDPSLFDCSGTCQAVKVTGSSYSTEHRRFIFVEMGYKRKNDGVHKKSLADELENPETQGVRVYPHKKSRSQSQQHDSEEWIDTNQSAKILSLAKEQQQEQAREQAKAASAADIGVPTLHAHEFCTRKD